MSLPNAIVVGRGYNALSIVRTLYRAGVSCSVLADKRTIAGWSRYAKYVRCPDAAEDEQGFQDHLVALCKTHSSPPVVIPTNDKWASAVAKSLDRLKDIGLCCVADAALIDLLLDKARFSMLGMTRNYQTLPSYSATDVGLIPDDSFPIVAKPNLRETSSNSPAENALNLRLGQLRLTVIETRKELEVFLRTNADLARYFVFQPYVAGDCSNMFSVCVYANKHHDVLGVFAGRKVRGYPPQYGDCARGETWSAPQDIVDLVRRICRELQYTGIAEFEFKRDTRTGQLYLIEINPRSWSWIGITPYCDVDLARMAYLDLTQGSVTPASSLSKADGDVAFGFLTAEMYGAYKYKDNPFSAKPAAILQDYLRGKVIIGDLDLKDPMVTAVGIGVAVRRFLSERH